MRLFVYFLQYAVLNQPHLLPDKKVKVCIDLLYVSMPWENYTYIIALHNGICTVLPINSNAGLCGTTVHMPLEMI